MMGEIVFFGVLMKAYKENLASTESPFHQRPTQTKMIYWEEYSVYMVHLSLL